MAYAVPLLRRQNVRLREEPDVLALGGDAEPDDWLSGVRAAGRGLPDGDQEPLRVSRQQVVEQGHQWVEVWRRERPAQAAHVVVDRRVPNERAVRKLGAAGRTVVDGHATRPPGGGPPPRRQGPSPRARALPA